MNDQQRDEPEFIDDSEKPNPDAQFPVQMAYPAPSNDRLSLSSQTALQQETIQEGRPMTGVNRSKPWYLRKVYICGMILVAIIIVLIVALVVVVSKKGDKRGKKDVVFIYADNAEYSDECTGQIQEDGWCVYEDKECSDSYGDPMTDELMEGFSVQDCKDFCGKTSDCEAFESKSQEECQIVFKSGNDWRTAHPTDEQQVPLQGTSCFVKIEGGNHTLAIEHFDTLEADCMEENDSGEQVLLQGYQMSEYFAEYNNFDNCLAGCYITGGCLAVDWYKSYQICIFYMDPGDRDVQIVASNTPYLDGVCYKRKDGIE